MKKQKFEDISDDPELEQYLLEVKKGKRKVKMHGPVKTALDILGK